MRRIIWGIYGEYMGSYGRYIRLCRGLYKTHYRGLSRDSIGVVQGFIVSGLNRVWDMGLWRMSSGLGAWVSKVFGLGVPGWAVRVFWFRELRLRQI